MPVGKVRWFDADKGTEKKVTFGDIAVLTRRRGGEAGLVARALLARGIPVTTAAEVNICDFFECFAIKNRDAAVISCH